jgi:putative transposase
MPGYDYSQAGAYFVTIVTQRHACLFGEIVDDVARFSPAGEMVAREWCDLDRRFSYVDLDVFVVMPNHLHGIVWLKGSGAEEADARRGESCHPPRARRGIRPEGLGDGELGDEHEVRPYGRPGRGTAARSLGRVIQAFKSMTTHAYVQGVKHRGWSRFEGRLWQRNYYEHVIRDDNDLGRLCEYVATNPLRWALDRENPGCWGG